jgi:hypothetical protein
MSKNKTDNKTSHLYDDADKKDSYKAYGAYEYYKRQVLERLFAVHSNMQTYDKCWYTNHWYDIYDPESSKQKNKIKTKIPGKSDDPDQMYVLQTFTDVANKMITAIISLKGQIEYLYPKIKKLDEDLQKKYYEIFDHYLDLKRNMICRYVFREENWKAYRAYVELIEDLGYSDMNVGNKGEMDEDW